MTHHNSYDAMNCALLWPHFIDKVGCFFKWKRWFDY